MNMSKINNEPLRLMLKSLNYNLVFAKLAFLQLGFQLPEFPASMTRAFGLASCSSTKLGECKTGDSVYEGLVARCCTIGWQSLSRERGDHAIAYMFSRQLLLLNRLQELMFLQLAYESSTEN